MIRRDGLISRHCLPAPIQEPVTIEISGLANHNDESNKISEETKKQPAAICTEQIGLGRKQGKDSPPADNTDQCGKITKLHILLAISIDEIDIPAYKGSKAKGTEDL